MLLDWKISSALFTCQNLSPGPYFVLFWGCFLFFYFIRLSTLLTSKTVFVSASGAGSVNGGFA